MMNQEIERKFLVTGDDYRSLAAPVLFRQGYLSDTSSGVVRVRLCGDDAFLTIKGPTRGITRQEYEYPIPRADAESMLDHLCRQPVISKFRYRIPHGGFVWEVDEFLGANAGLIVAEIELPGESTPFEKPPWVGAEVSHDPRYYNSNLANRPFAEWRNDPP